MTALRSLLFVPGNRPDRMRKALAAGADVLILDLEDSVPLADKRAARDAVADFLMLERAMRLYVRVNSLTSGMIDDDLAVILAGSPDGIVLPKVEGEESLASLDRRLDGDIAIIAIGAETPSAIFRLGSYGGVTERLVGLTWGAEDLSAAIGAPTSREADGGFSAPYQLARSLTLFGAHAARIAAIETVYPDFSDLDGLAAYALRGRRDGFTGMMAIHPVQVPIINAAFTPSPDELARARRIVELFAANPGAGALSLDGSMLDTPHLIAAQRLLESGAPN